MGRFWETLKLALRDQAVGAAKYGASSSPAHNRAAMLAAKAERERLEGRWTSRYRSNTGKIDVLLDKKGNPTTSYPHVHVAYNEQEGKVHVILSLGPRSHPTKEILPGDATGNQVNEAVRRMQRHLP